MKRFSDDELCTLLNEQEERILNEKHRYKNLPFDRIATAQKEMKKNGKPPLEFETNQSTVLCTLKGALKGNQ